MENKTYAQLSEKLKELKSEYKENPSKELEQEIELKIKQINILNQNSKRVNFDCLSGNYKPLKSNKIPNDITDWLKTFSYTTAFLFIFCYFTNKDWFFSLATLSFVGCIAGFGLFYIINEFIEIFEKL